MVPRRLFPLLLGVVLLLAVILRLLNIGGAEMWADERISVVREARGGLLDFDGPGDPSVQGDAPGYPLPIRWLLGRVDPGPDNHFAVGDRARLRLLSALAGIAAVMLLFLLMRSVADRDTALIAAALLSFSFYGVYYSQEHRPYALWVAWSLLATWLFVLVFLRGRRRLAPVYGLAVGTLLYLHYAAVFVPAAHALALAAMAVTRVPLRTDEDDGASRFGRADLVAGAVAVAVALLIAWPWLGHLLDVVSAPGHFNPDALMEPGRPVTWAQRTHLMSTALSRWGAGGWWSFATYLPLALIGLWSAWRQRPAAALLLASFYVTPLVVIATTDTAAYLFGRHLMFGFPIHQALAAWGVVTLADLTKTRRAGRLVAAALVLALLAHNVWPLAFYYAHDVKCTSMQFIDFCQTFVDPFNFGG